MKRVRHGAIENVIFVEFRDIEPECPTAVYTALRDAQAEWVLSGIPELRALSEAACILLSSQLTGADYEARLADCLLTAPELGNAGLSPVDRTAGGTSGA